VRERISAFVVSCNRAPLIGTCLRALRFADEVIVVDKSSSDETPSIAARHADRVITVPWSPTVEETRAFAAAQCAHDWLLYLDDDECLSPEAVQFIEAELAAPQADIYALPQRHYILGVHDESAYYWPEYQTRLFRRDAVAFSATVHAGIIERSDRVLRVAPETGVAIHHLSHLDVAQWIEKANRYTARADRARVEHDGQDLTRFAHQRIDHWLARTRDTAPGGYPEAVALLRATYDLVDRLKTWEEERGLDAAGQFRRVCAALDAAHAAPGPLRLRAGEVQSAMRPPEVAPDEAADQSASLRERVAAFRARHDALTRERDLRAAEVDAATAATAAHRAEAEAHRAEAEAHRAEAEVHRAEAEARGAEALRLAADLSDARDALGKAYRTIDAERRRAGQAESASFQALAEAEAQRLRAEAIEASTFWRSTVIPRRLAERAKRLVRRQSTRLPATIRMDDAGFGRRSGVARP
jgi:hypothetical protein